MKIKKTIAAIAALTMALSSLPVMAFADDADTGTGGGVVVNDASTMPSLTGSNVSYISGATNTVEVSSDTITINFTKTGDTVTGGKDPSDAFTDNNHTDPYTNGAFLLTVPGDFSGYTMPKETNDANNTYYKPDDDANGATNLTSSGLYLYLSADAVFGDGKPNTVTYKVPIKKDDTTEYITIVLNNVTAATPNPGEGDVVTPEEDWTAKPAGVHGITGGTGAVEKETAEDGTINVTVTLTPSAADATIAGKPQQGSGVQNYYVVIPGLGTNTEWELSTGGDDGGQYGYDEDDHTYNVDANGNLRLWLPVAPAAGKDTCKVVLTKDDDKKIVIVKTVVGTYTAPVTTPTDAQKLASAVAAVDFIEANYEFDTWVNISQLQGGNADNVAGSIQNALRNDDWGFGIDGAEVTMVRYEFTSNSDMVTFTIKVKIGAEEAIKEITVKCNDDRVVSGGDVVAPAPAPVPVPVITGDSGVPAVVVSYTPAATTVTSTSQIASSSKSNISINAKETKVTTKMVNAFVKNSKAKTLTLNYGTKVKIAIAKGDVKSAAAVAKMDFSATTKTPSDAVKKEAAALTKGKIAKVTQMNFKSTAKFDGVSKVTVQNRVGGQYAGQKAVVYEIVDGKLVKVATAKVGGSGLVSFKISHFGQYVIAVEK